MAHITNVVLRKVIVIPEISITQIHQSFSILFTGSRVQVSTVAVTIVLVNNQIFFRTFMLN